MYIPGTRNLQIKDIIEEKFEIPIYQRPYKWRKEHVIQLLDDLYENIYCILLLIRLYRSYYKNHILLCSNNMAKC